MIGEKQGLRKLDFSNLNWWYFSYHLKIKYWKIQPYEEKGDMGSYLTRYFGDATNNLTDEKRRFELKKAFLNSYLAKHIRELDNIDEMYNII